MVPMIGRPLTPVSARLPSTPNCGPGCAAPNSGGSFMSTIRMPLKPRMDQTPPMAMVVSAAEIRADRLQGKLDIGFAAVEQPVRAGPRLRERRGLERLQRTHRDYARADPRLQLRRFARTGTNVPVD